MEDQTPGRVILAGSKPKILGVIPARGGSKGLPRKNVRKLGGESLIVHSIKVALLSNCLERLIVSTDDRAIADTAKRYGAEVPWSRPVELASDESPIQDTVLHLIKSLVSKENYHPEAVMLLQPTSPFRSVNTIREAVRIYKKYSGESVISVSPVRDHPYWCKSIGDDGVLMDFIRKKGKGKRRQELPPVYRLNGVLYLASIETLKTKHSFYSPHPRPLVVPEDEALDIDSPLDWEMAKYYLGKRMVPEN